MLVILKNSLKILTPRNVLKKIKANVGGKSSPFIQTSKPVLQNVSRQAKNEKIGPFGWLLLVIPASTFGLGTWQVQRKKWKEALIADLHNRTEADPVPLPKDIDELTSLEYKPVYVRGQFLHDRELYLGPRTLLLKGDSSTESHLISGKGTSQGYLVVTPFKLADRDQTILVNRGWVPANKKNPKTRSNGQVSDIVDVVGVVRLHENRPTFLPKNNVQMNNWFYRDLDAMARVTGASPIFLDATNDFDVKDGPIGGQTRVTLRNEHLSYIVTWYSLSAITSFMWYRQFIQKLPLK